MMRGVMALAIVLAHVVRFCTVATGGGDCVGALAWKTVWKRHRASSRPSIEQRVGSSDLRAFVRLSVEWPTLQRAAAGEWSALDERLDAYARRAIPVLLAIGPRDGSSAETDNWVPVVQAVARHLVGRVAGYQIEAATTSPDPREYAFQLKLAAVQIKAIDAAAVIAQATVRAADTAWLNAVYAEGTAAYVDLAPVAAPARFGDARDAGLAAAIGAGRSVCRPDADRCRARQRARPKRRPPATNRRRRSRQAGRAGIDLRCQRRRARAGARRRGGPQRSAGRRAGGHRGRHDLTRD